MNKKVNFGTVVFILTLILIIAVLSVILFTKLNLHTIDLKNNIFWGVVCGLCTYIITFYIIQKFHYSSNDKILEKVENLLNNFHPHDNTTKTILDVVQCKYMTLISYDRRSLLGTHFYEDTYKESSEIKILGITLAEFLKSLISGNHIIIHQLLNDSNIYVKILLMHPESEFVKILDKQESTSQDSNPVKTKISKLISSLENFSKKERLKATNSNNRLEIRLTTEHITMTINHAQKKEVNVNDVLLLGLLYGHKEGGPLYQIPKNFSNEIYDDCIKYFDKLYENANNYQLFSWDSQGKHYSSNILSL